MDKSKVFLTAAVIFVGLGVLLIWQSLQLGKFRLIACDIGQGDGMLIIAPGGQEIVIDGGPGRRILDCLGRHMPFWDRKVEMMVLTHPHAEHMEGLLAILDSYRVGTVVTTDIPNDTQMYKAWHERLLKSGAKVYEPNVGDALRVGTIAFDILWPPRDKIEQWKRAPAADLNDTSIVMRLDYGQFCGYLTGDLPKEVLATLINRQCDLLKVVHHGSKTGTDEEVLSKIRPKIAVIQVGAKNQFGHPHKEVLDVLNKFGVKILRNDLNGEIEIVTDGKTLNLTKSKD